MIKNSRNWKYRSKFWFIQGVEKGKLRGCVNDFLLRRYSNILLVKDIIRGQFLLTSFNLLR